VTPFRSFKGTKTPSAACPRCQKLLDRVDALIGGPATPKPGDVTLCIGCGTILVFTPGLGLRIARPDDMEELSPEQTEVLAMARQFVKQARIIRQAEQN
jgi:hypothetical protein